MNIDDAMTAPAVFARACPLGLGGIIQLWVEAPDLDRRLAPHLSPRADTGTSLPEPGDIRYALLRDTAGHTLDEVLLTRDGLACEINCHGGTASVRAVSAMLTGAGFCEIPIHAWWLRQALARRIGLPDCEARLLWPRTETTLAAAVVSASMRLADRAAAEACATAPTDPDLASAAQHALSLHRVALCGAPNTGKSTLLNRLVGTERALVSEAAGTTRDAVRVRASCEGLAVEWIDTAGFLDGAGAIDAEAIRRARGCVAGADLRVLLLDAGRPVNGEDRAAWEACRGLPTLTVLNKADRLGDAGAPEADAGMPAPRLCLSARSDPDAGPLCRLIAATLLPERDALETHLRHGKALPATRRQAAWLSALAKACQTGGHDDAEAAWRHLSGLSLDANALRREVENIAGELAPPRP